VAVLAIGLAALLGAFGGSSRDPGRPSGVRVGPTIANVGRRPNGVVVAGGTVWVSSAGLDRLTGLDARTGRRLAASPEVGRSVVAMAFTGSEVWVALDRPARLVRLDRSGARIGDELPLPRTPIGIDATRDAVWVAVAGEPGVRDSVLRYEPGTGRRVGRIAPADGVRAIAAGPDGVWIAHQGLPTVAHVDASGKETVRAFLRQPAYDLTYGAGYAWASLRNDDTVARIAPDTGDVVQIAAPRRPMQLSVAGGRVFVPGYIDNAVGVIDPRTARPVGRALPAGLNPFASASDADHVWVTSVANNSVTRFDVL
jgi:DNA-binding beta-propeller fold protein YncE